MKKVEVTLTTAVHGEEVQLSKIKAASQTAASVAAVSIAISLLLFCQTPSVTEAAKRTGVIDRGTTLGPGFVIISGKGKRIVCKRDSGISLKGGVVFLNSDSHPPPYNMTKCNILLVHVHSFHL